jgi:glyoxylase-like metal-dependent hydrolase (beta-lactamase superfamily II)
VTEPATTPDWTEPGAYPVAPGVHRVPLPLPTDGLRAVNVYVIADGDGLVLIDGGWALASARAALAEALATLGCGLPDIRHFLVTHVHRDHYTQAVWLRREFGPKVSLGAGEQASMAALLSGSQHPFHAQLAELRASGAEPVAAHLARLADAPRGGADGWEPPDEWLLPGQELTLSTRSLRVVAHITPSIGFEVVAARQPLRDYLQSLRLVRSLPDLRLLPAHGPVTGSSHARIDELLAHHEDRLNRCAAAVAGGAATAYEVALALRWTRRARRLAELDPFNQMLAVIETRAHLELLAAQGKLAAAREGAVTVYAPAPGPGG